MAARPSIWAARSSAASAAPRTGSPCSGTSRSRSSRPSWPRATKWWWTSWATSCRPPWPRRTCWRRTRPVPGTDTAPSRKSPLLVTPKRRGAAFAAPRTSIPTRLLAEPLVDRGLVLRDPLLSRLVRIHVLARDEAGDIVLIRVRPAEVLDDGDGRRAARRELLAHELREHVRRVGARVLRRRPALLLVVQAALEPLRELDLRELIRRVQILRVVPVEEHRLLLLVQLLPPRDLRRLSADAHELEVQVERLDQRLVLLLIRRVAAEEHPLRTRLGALEERLFALEALPRLELRVLLHQVRRDVPADHARNAVLAGIHDRVLLRHVLLLLGNVAPVLEDRVRLPVRHRLVDRDLGDLRDVDLAPEVLLEHVLDDVGVGRRAGPRLLVDRHRAARPCLGPGSAGRYERDDDRQDHTSSTCPHAFPPLLHHTIPSRLRTR